MSETVDFDNAVGAVETNETPTEPEATEGKSFTQEDVNKIVEDRLARERQKYSEFETYKEKAEKFSELEARVTTAEAKVAETELALVRARVSAETGIPENVLQGNDEAAIRQTAEDISNFVSKKASSEPAVDTRVVLQSGSAKTADLLTPQERAAAALRGLRG
jgi:hypothetical protein